MPNAVLLFSGGMDSTICLYLAKQDFGEIHALTIDYGQRHRTELDAAKTLAKLAGASHEIISIPDLFSNNNALAGRAPIVVPMSGLPSTFVPCRNVIFLTLAAIRAIDLKTNNIIGGMCQTDFNGYPDCRRETIDALKQTLRLATLQPILIHTPLMYLSKVESVRLARQIPGCWEALKYSQTCYQGCRPPCGECPACRLRAEGFKGAKELDPLLSDLKGGLYAK
jgi:7-cyano-7-deazaguanine synthase